MVVRTKFALLIGMGLLSLNPLVHAGSVSNSQPPDFVKDVMPVLVKSGCNGGSCHGSFQGRGGFQLSLFGFDPRVDYEALVRESRQRRVFVPAPDWSLMLRKPLQKVPHGGGKRFEAESESHRILRDWITQGTPHPADFDLHVNEIRVSALDMVLKPKEHKKLHVEAVWSDGEVRDVTRWALYEVRDEYCAGVDRDGRISAHTAGRTAVTVSFLGQVKAVNVTVPHPKPGQPLVFAGNNYIDKLVAAEWEKIGLRPVELASDEEFLRRIYLDVIGTLPTPKEIETFLKDSNPQKREKLVDRLLERSEYVDYWSYRWADLLRVHRRYVGDKGMWSFWNWVRKSVRENWPMDKLARELLVSQGGLFSNGATAYYFVDEDPAQLAGNHRSIVPWGPVAMCQVPSSSL